MSHLTPDEIVDAVEGSLDSLRHVHLDACTACRGEIDRLTSVLADTRTVAMPEPSPLFWEHFSRRVRLAIAEEPAAKPSPGWLRWPVLTPLAAMALLVFALVTAVPRSPETGTPPIASAAPALTTELPPMVAAADSDVDSAWAFIVESVGPLDVDAAQQAGIAAGPGEAERAALHLSDDEQVELVRLLEEELTRAGSS